MIEVFPRTYDPVPTPPGCPILRCSGVFGFLDPVTGREWGLFGRSDGLLLTDATPAQPVTGIDFSTSTIPPSPVNAVWFLAEPNPSPLQPAPSHNGIYDLLNGWDQSVSSYVHYSSYCTEPGSIHPYPYSTAHSLNREVTVWYDESADRFWVFSVNALRNGVWAIPLLRASQQLQFDSSNAGWLAPSWLGACHTIYLDNKFKRIFIADDTNSKVVGLSIQTGAPNAANILNLSSPFIYAPTSDWRDPATGLVTPNLPVRAHDAMPAGGYVYVTLGGLCDPPASPATDLGYGSIDILELTDSPAFVQRLHCGPPGAPLVFPNVASGHVATLAGTHSLYIEVNSTPEASLWVEQEDSNPVFYSNGSYTTIRVGIVRFAHSSPEEPSKFRETIPFVIPDGYAAGHRPARVHNLRGEGRFGLQSQYVDGITAVDLSDVQDQGSSYFSSNLSVLGSYDTSFQTEPLSPSYTYQHPDGLWYAPNYAQDFIDGWDGCWDTYVHQDSGFIYASCGKAGAVVFQLREGNLNRFGSATPFQGSPPGNDPSSVGMFPRIELVAGPPRQGRQVILRDGNRGNYSLLSPGSPFYPVKYMFKLRYSVGVSQSVIDGNYAPFANCVPSAGTNYLTNTVLETPWSNSDLIVTPVLPARGTILFAQMLVREYRFINNQWQAQPYWAASRGIWMGVAKP